MPRPGERGTPAGKDPLMIANLQAHYGFTVMPFISAFPVEAL